jgi:hypothetical protein
MPSALAWSLPRVPQTSHRALRRKTLSNTSICAFGHCLEVRVRTRGACGCDSAYRCTRGGRSLSPAVRVPFPASREEDLVRLYVSEYFVRYDDGRQYINVGGTRQLKARARVRLLQRFVERGRLFEIGSAAAALFGGESGWFRCLRRRPQPRRGRSRDVAHRGRRGGGANARAFDQALEARAPTATQTPPRSI